MRPVAPNSGTLKFLLLLVLFFLSNAPLRAARVVETKPQSDAMQNVPRQRTPSQPAVPGSTEQPQQPTTPHTEQYTLSEDRYQKAVAYSRAMYFLWFLSYAIGIAALILFLRFGISARLRDLAEQATGNRWLQGLIFVPLLILALDICELPTRIYGHSLSLRYQQSVQGWGSWSLDWLKEEALGAAFTVVLGLILFRLVRWSPRRWWLYFWMAALPIAVVVIFLQPLVIDPLFFKFEPLQSQQPQLVGAMEKVINRVGLSIPPDRMFLMFASAKSNEVNAYVTGFGASKRVVVWDTTIQKMTTDETLFVFGHEAGHYVLNHIRKGFFFFSTLFLLAMYVGYRG